MKMDAIKKIIDNPIVTFTVGVLLVVSSLSEIETTLLEDIGTLGLRIHHGVSILGFWHMLKAVLDFFEGRDRFQGFFHYSSFIVIIVLISFLLFLSEIWPTLREILNISWFRSHLGVGIFTHWRVVKVFLDLYEEGERFWGAFRHVHVSLIIGLILFLSCLLAVFNTSWLRSHHGVTILSFWYVLGDVLDLYRAEKRFRTAFRRSPCQEEE